MPIRVALHHVTQYLYDRPIQLGAQTIRLRPAPHCRTPVLAYSLNVEPSKQFLNWQQDPFGNFAARLVFPDVTRELKVTVDLIAEMTVINPFDFFVEEYGTEFPFKYDPDLAKDLKPFLDPPADSPLLKAYIAGIDVRPRRTINFLVDLNQKLQKDIKYLIRMEPGVQTAEETLQRKSGSCRDSAWLLVQILRHFGLAARFVSGYLIQLTPDVKSLDGPSGTEVDFTDLHAWTEVFLPGAGWVGLDPTSGLFTGEGHLPLAATPAPQTAAPISGLLEPCETKFDFKMTVTRVHEDPRVTKPYTDAQWEAVDRAGQHVDEILKRDDVRLTMGGEPTFVSIDNVDSPEWNIEAVGPTKAAYSANLIRRLHQRYAPKGFLHYGQGKWYPGESLPRWAFTCLWRTDGEPLWQDPKWLALAGDTLVQRREPSAADTELAAAFSVALARTLEVESKWIRPAYEDPWHAMHVERRLPVDVDPLNSKLEDHEERRRLARLVEQGLTRPVGYVLPLTRAWWQARPNWTSGPWPMRAPRLMLIPGDSPIGLRLPLDSLPGSGAWSQPSTWPRDMMSDWPQLPQYEELRKRIESGRGTQQAFEIRGVMRDRAELRQLLSRAIVEQQPPDLVSGPGAAVRTALCIEPRDGRLHVFMPPVSMLEDYVELLAFIEQTAVAIERPVVIEGYLPPHDPRLKSFKVTPDPGVIEVNVPPAKDWEEAKEITLGLYEDAYWSRLRTEKFQVDGKHSGTGGGNHVVLGGPTTADSPFLRRPDLLRSFISYWNNHPSLSYLFSSMFIGPTSQAPRVDEARRDSIYEMELAFEQVPDRGYFPPWLVDRVFRHLLTDLTGNTHRAEFCIDKLFSPDSSTGRLGLVELRAFEMPPHPRMSLVQQLLVRALTAWFWKQPYQGRLIRWGTALHDRWMMPHYLWLDMAEVVRDLRRAEFPIEFDWFLPHWEFRCPFVGEIARDGLRLEVRQALEPWYVLGEEPAGGGTTRFVDSSCERLQLKIFGRADERVAVACNGRKIPLQPTGVPGEYVGAVRFRSWQPASCLHPTIRAHTPLVFDLVDVAAGRSIAGCKYHIEHPGGINPNVFPVNALEAECRRAARFLPFGHTGGSVALRDEPPPTDFPCTLDLRGRGW